MTKYINKSALVAEIEKRLKEYRTFPDYQTDSNYMELCEILSFLNTLEVKEINSTDAFIEKACKWLKENKDHPFIGCEDCCLSGFLTDEFVEEFRKAMKGE